MAASEALLDQYMDGLTNTMPSKVQDALAKVPDRGRKLLALRGYLKTQRNINTDWAWSNQQADDFRATVAGKYLRAEITKVQKQFATDNPDYKLRTAKLVRTLETQINLWNSNESVGAAAQKLVALALKELEKPVYAPEVILNREAPPLAVSSSAAKSFSVRSSTAPASPGDSFKKFLRKSYPGSIMVATPGLSDHGHANAIDFTVVEVKTGKVVATASKAQIETVWEKQGLGDALADAIEDSHSKFIGPLGSPQLPGPKEPWHWTITLKTDSTEMPLKP